MQKCCFRIAGVLIVQVLTSFIFKSIGQYNPAATAYGWHNRQETPANNLQPASGKRVLSSPVRNQAGNTETLLSCNDWLFVPGVPSCVNIGDLDVSGTQLTVEAVINRTTPYTGSDLFAGDVVSKHTSPTDANYLLRPSSAEITTTNGYFRTPVICSIQLNKTYHIALVYNGAVLKFYRNGFLMSQIAATGNLFQNDLSTLIGHYSGPFINEGFVGYINEVRIWNTARTQNEIQTYLNTSLPLPQTGLLAYYVFNNLQNKQGNTTWDGKLNSNAQINQTNPTCSSFVIDSCGSAPLCRFQSLNIQDNQPACRTISLTSPVTASSGAISSYQWSFGDGTFSSGQPATHTYQTPGTYTVKLLVLSSATCKDSISKQITVSSVTANAGKDTVVCQNQSVTLRGGINAVSYTWSPGRFLSDSMVASPVATVQNSTRFLLTVRGAQGCTDTSSVFVAVRSKPVFNAVSAYTVCKGEVVSLGVSNADEVVWSPATYLSNAAISNPLCRPASSIQYTVHVRERTCNTDSNIVVGVAVRELPVVTASSSNDIDCSSLSSQLDAAGASVYRWSPAAGLSDTAAKNPVAAPVVSTAYTVKGTDTAGCSASGTVEVIVSKSGSAVYVLPNAFSPNNDGHNDCFGIKHWRGLTQVEFSIFNRWGQRLYFSTSSSACWDGRFKGILQDAGAYVYMVKAVSACATISRKGTVLLLK